MNQRNFYLQLLQRNVVSTWAMATLGPRFSRVETMMSGWVLYAGAPIVKHRL